MLTIIQQHHIKYLYEYKGMSLRAIAKETGHSFQTIKKYAHKEDPNPLPTPRKPKKSKIDEWLEEDQKMPPVSLRAVQHYVGQQKRDIYQESEEYLPLEHSPGRHRPIFTVLHIKMRKRSSRKDFF